MTFYLLYITSWNLKLSEHKYIYSLCLLLARLYVRVGLFLAYGKHLQGRIISQSGKLWAHRTNSTPPRFIGVPVASKKSEWSYICVLGVSILPPPMIFKLARIIFGTVLTILFHRNDNFNFFLRYKSFYILTNTVWPLVTASTLIWFMRYIHYCNLHLLNNAIIVQTKVLLPRAYVTVADHGCSVYAR